MRGFGLSVPAESAVHDRLGDAGLAHHRADDVVEDRDVDELRLTTVRAFQHQACTDQHGEIIGISAPEVERLG
jgi:hypothetical protein